MKFNDTYEYPIKASFINYTEMINDDDIIESEMITGYHYETQIFYLLHSHKDKFINITIQRSKNNDNLTLSDKRLILHILTEYYHNIPVELMKAIDTEITKVYKRIKEKQRCCIYISYKSFNNINIEILQQINF